MLFTILLLAVAGVAIFSADLLILVAKEQQNSSYEIIAEKCYGNGECVFTVIMIDIHLFE